MLTRIYEDGRSVEVIGDLFEERNACDYNARFVIVADAVESRINDAEYFYNEVCKHFGIVG